MARTPFIAQMEAAECGAACLAMVLGHYGHHAPLAEVRAACGVSRDGTTAVALVRAAEAYGLAPTAHRVELHDLPEVLPAVLHWELNHFVVLTKVSRTGLHVLDPALGPRCVSFPVADDAFSGVRLSFRPGPAFRKRRRAVVSLARYAALLKASPALLLAALAALGLELIGLVFPVLSQVAIDFIVRPKQSRFLWPLAVVLLVASVWRVFMAHARNRIVSGIRVGINTWLSTSFVEHLMRLPLPFYTQRSSGDLASRVEGHAVIRDVVKAASNAVLDALLVVSYSLMMLAYQPLLAAIAIGVNVVRVTIVLLVQSMVRDAVASEVVAAGREASVIAESFAAPEAVKAFAMEAGIERRYADAMSGRLNASGRREQIRRSVNHLLPVLDGAGLALTYAAGGVLVARDQMTIGVLSAFVAMATLLSAPVASVVAAATGFPQLKQVLRRLDDIWETSTEREDGAVLSRLGGAITAVGLSVRFGSRTVLDNVSLHIAAGERVAIVGKSGSGKSTLLQVLGAMLAPTSGELWFDGRPASELSLGSLRARIASVPPQVLPVAATVFDNITLGQPGCDAVQVSAAARAACIHDDIVALPDGYETKLERSGVPLSGGQNQRIGLARAFLKPVDVLLLDEATSSLDPALEARVFERLRELGCTQVFVTHRISAMRRAQRVIVMADGKVVEQGSFDEVWARCAVLREMVDAERGVQL